MNERDTNEQLVRLINTFIFNSNPYRKASHYIKNPQKLYKISADFDNQEIKKEDIKYAKMSKEEYQHLQQSLFSLINKEGTPLIYN